MRFFLWTIPLKGCATLLLFVYKILSNSDQCNINKASHDFYIIPFFSVPSVMRSGYTEAGSKGQIRSGPNVPSPAVTNHISWNYEQKLSPSLWDIKYTHQNTEFFRLGKNIQIHIELNVLTLMLLILSVSGLPCKKLDVHNYECTT